jgi:hypothetical protein
MSELPQWINEAHQQHCHKPGQTESEDNRLLARLGHPMAEQYRRARNHFDQLTYAASLYHRFYSVKDSDNFSLVSAPGLLVVIEQTTLSLAELARAHAALGWPHSTMYQLNCGGWQVKTTDKKLVEEFRRFTPCRITEMGNGKSLLSIETTDADTFEWISSKLDTHQANFFETLRRPVPHGEPIVEDQLRQLCNDTASLPDAWI